MCSRMEKELLIEEVSVVSAFIGYRFRKDEPVPEEFFKTEELQNFLYATSPELIDADEIRKELAELKKPFLYKPIVFP